MTTKNWTILTVEGGYRLAALEIDQGSQLCVGVGPVHNSYEDACEALRTAEQRAPVQRPPVPEVPVRTCPLCDGPLS